MKTETKNTNDLIEYIVAKHYLGCLINGDASGLTAEEVKQIEVFEEENLKLANTIVGFKHGYWSYEADCDNRFFQRCEISGLMSDCLALNYVCIVS